MTAEQIKEIRLIIDAGGWNAAKKHPVYGPLVRRMFAEQRSFESSL